MSLGYVIGESKPTFVTAITSRPLSVGEYIMINTNEGKILGLVEKSKISSAAFADVRNFDEAAESTEIAEINKRDKTFTANIGILGFLDKLQKGQSIIPAIPPIPGTEIVQPTKHELEAIFSSEEKGWEKIGNLLRNKTIEARVNIDKIVSRHLGILAMTGMGKSNLVSLVAKQIGKLNGTIIIFDYHNDYTSLNFPRINVVDAKINPRLLDADQLSEVLEIRDGAFLGEGGGNFFRQRSQPQLCPYLAGCPGHERIDQNPYGLQGIPEPVHHLFHRIPVFFGQFPRLSPRDVIV